MPEYLYHDGRGHTRALKHRMLYTTGIICACGLAMHRVPQSPRINWNGDTAARPASPIVRQMIAEAPRKREEFAAVKAQHVRDGVTRYERK